MNPAPLEERSLYTYREYARLPEGAPYQLIGGKLVMTPSPSPYHQRVSKRLEFFLYDFVEKQHHLGEIFDAPIDVYFEETEVYQPDIIFISQERQNIIGEQKIEGAPDLIIEVLSPSTAYYDLKHKMRVYARHGVKEYWIVDPLERGIEVFENKNGEFFLFSQATNRGEVVSKLLTGFRVMVEDIF
ncbi:MAG: Uma2 family endonuclease [Nitrospinota bacterium]|nr:MAG: Uma2 family endonuclease [Nitrospinota bacterium]